VSDERGWLLRNEEFLAAALAWLRLLLELPPERGLELAVVAATMRELADADPPPALRLLSRRLGLSPFEEQVVLLCVAMDLDTRIAGLCARAQDDASRPYPTFALALARLDEPAWDALSPDRPLRSFRLIEIEPRGGQPLTGCPLRADERIVNYVKGLNVLDDRLATLVTVEAEPAAALPASQLAVLESVLAHVRQLAPGQQRLVVQLVGGGAGSKRTLARHAAAVLGSALCRLPGESLPAQPAELEAFARLWQRESRLLPMVLYLVADEVEPAGEGAGPRGPVLRRFLERGHGLFVVDTREPLPDLDGVAAVFDVPGLTPVEQQAAWAASLGPLAGNAPSRLAGQFDLDAGAIERIAETALAEAAGPEAVAERAWDLCRRTTRPGLETLAQRLDPRASWDDIVLPPDVLALLRGIAGQVRHRITVYDDWGFRKKLSRGLGISALFAGASGTGKTMAAEVIANELRLDLYRIDLSAVVSKYIGETEKNLRRLFDAAEGAGAILFFDEADALFGKRSEVKDSHDRYANIEINYLLQRMEGYRGLAILATNLRSALDQAFLRRLRFIVPFPHPGPAERAEMWRKAFPASTATPGLDPERLARLDLTGSSIQTIALNAAFAAAAGGLDRVPMPLVLDAARAELRKLERPVNEADPVWRPPVEVVG
jgi:hypothetical protein